MVELSVPVRLRRAIIFNDIFLVKRIIRHNPRCLENPDYEDKSNTSLHLAAILGHIEILKFLVDFGHDSSDVTVNTDSSTALHLAAANSHPACVDVLCSAFPHTIERPDKAGVTPLMLAARASNPNGILKSTNLIPPTQRPRSSSKAPISEDTKTVATLLGYGASVAATDSAGNTALHHASAWGNLKTFRLLVQWGALPLARNKSGCFPTDYALTNQAAAYCKSFITEFRNQRKGTADKQSEEEWERQTQQRQQVQQKTKLSLLVKPSELAQFANNSRMSPISPSERMREFGKRGSASPGKHSFVTGLRLVENDNEREDIEEAPLTGFKLSFPRLESRNRTYESD